MMRDSTSRDARSTARWSAVSRSLIPPRAQARLLAAALLVVSIAAPSRLSASSLDVLPAAAQRGAEGLRVTVGSSCASPQDQVVESQTLNGPTTIEACQSVTSSSTTIASGEVTFRAGERIALGDGFVVQFGATFVAEIDGVLTPNAYVEDRTLGAEPHYATGFFVNLDSLALGSSDRFDLLAGRSASGVKWLSLVLKRNSTLGENRIVIEARQDNGTIVSTEGVAEVALPSGWSWLSMVWKAASSGSSDGFIRLYRNGLFFTQLASISNTSGSIGTVRLGAHGVDPGTSGSLDLDHFISRIGGPIAVPP